MLKEHEDVEDTEDMEDACCMWNSTLPGQETSVSTVRSPGGIANEKSFQGYEQNIAYTSARKLCAT